MTTNRADARPKKGDHAVYLQQMQRPKRRDAPLVNEVWLYDAPPAGYDAATGQLFGPPEFVAEAEAILRGEQT
jgi:hypothetical protein